MLISIDQDVEVTKRGIVGHFVMQKIEFDLQTNNVRYKIAGWKQESDRLAGYDPIFEIDSVDEGADLSVIPNLDSLLNARIALFIAWLEAQLA